MVHSRLSGDDPWIATALTDGDVLHMPKIGIEIPIAEFHEGTDLLIPAASGIGGGVAMTP